MSQLTSLNKSHYRKTYSKLGHHKPVILNLDRQYDINHMVFDRNHLSLPCAPNLGVTSSIYYAEYEEGYVYFNNETEVQTFFTTTFTDEPFTTIEILPASGLENINFSIYQTTPVKFVINTSANFTGWFKYYSVHSVLGYPTTILSGAIPKECTAGSLTIASADTVSQSLVPSCSVVPTTSSFCLYETVLDLGSSFFSGSINSSGSFLTGSFSANYTNKINYINLV